MTFDAPHLTDISLIEISKEQKDKIPVSVTQSETGELIVVSRYGDSIWDFYPYIPQENLKNSGKQLNWNFRLGNEILLTDPEYDHLLESAKDFIWSLFSTPIPGRRLSRATLIAKAELLLPLMRWMVAQGMDQFHQLDGHTMEYVSVARFKYGSTIEVSKSTFHYRLHILEYLYLQREKLKDAPRQVPWPLDTAQSLSGQRRGGNERKPSTAVIPDQVVKQLIKNTFEYIYERAPVIISALKKAQSIAEAHVGLRRQSIVDARTTAAREDGFSGSMHLRSESILLRTSCYIVIDIFSGLRDSEMLSLEAGCITHETSTDMDASINWLHGTIYKMGMRSKKWLVPRPVVDAVEILTQLSAPLRQKLHDERESYSNSPAKTINRSAVSKRRHIVRSQQNKLFLAVANKYGNEISVVSGAQIGRDLKKFCTHFSVNHEAVAYRLHAHQFRRSYARFVARAELGDLITLKEHLGHWTLDMTIYYADGASDEFEVDTELVEMIANEKSERHYEIVHSYLTTESPVATGAGWLRQWRQIVRTAENKEQLVKEYAGTISLNGTGHSWCAGSSKGAGCGGLCVFQAQTCVDCHYGIIGQEHRPVWEGIRQQQLEALELDDMGPGGKVRTQEILQITEKVLRRLDGSET